MVRDSFLASAIKEAGLSWLINESVSGKTGAVNCVDGRAPGTALSGLRLNPIEGERV
jgi:hypothetical protein